MDRIRTRSTAPRTPRRAIQAPAADNAAERRRAEQQRRQLAFMRIWNAEVRLLSQSSDD